MRKVPKKLLIFALLSLVILSLVIIFGFQALSSAPLYQQGTEEGHGYKIFSLELPSELQAGTKVDGSISLQLWNKISCPTCVQQLLIIPEWDPTNPVCIYSGVPGTYPGELIKRNFTLELPSTAGRYGIYVFRALQYGCPDAVDFFLSEGGLSVASKVKEIEVS
ncbi:MAG TPA: hypothetical protein ENG56_00385 [Candidatus Aenigmarchaeota archaeon]|nr:hypothetical protein [Candidatus Aenigmarchaeota archaeon]